MKYSKQRETILKAVQNSCDHPSADTIYQLVKQELPQISLGTVYRNLNLLAEAGQIRKISMDAGGDRFDKTLVNHYHMYCPNCRRVFDIPGDQFERLNETISNETGHKIDKHDILFLGTCKHCLNK